MRPRALGLVESPFRYPGAKNRLVSTARTWLLARGNERIVEPFAGGASVSLAAVSEGLAGHATLNELDEDVAGVWKVMLGERAYELIALVDGFELTDEAVARVLSEPPGDEVERAFATLLKNRVTWGGIMARAGVLRNDDTRRGFATRWTPRKLITRMTAIAALRDRFSFIHGDGLDLLRERTISGATVFIDPPYLFEASQRTSDRLYRHSVVDHAQLFELAAAHDGEVLLSYDDQPQVRALAFEHGFDVRAIPTRTAHHRRSTELLIGRDLAWLPRPQTGARRLRHSASSRRRVVAAAASAGPTKIAPVGSLSENSGRLIHVESAANELRVSRRTVERMVRAGKLEGVLSGGRSFVTKDSLAQLQRQTRERRHAAARSGPTADLVASVERLVAALREERGHLLEALQEREAARVELATTRAELEGVRSRCQCAPMREAA